MNFHHNKIISKEPEQKVIPNSPGSHYYIIPLLYLCEDLEFTDEFILEGCEMESYHGIIKRSKRDGSSGRDQYLIKS